MPTVWIAFLTGLTAGGLSCLAVQGGLLASTLAQDIEKQVSRKHHAQAIAAFVATKIAAYTVLGALLGWLGTSLEITPAARGWIQLLVGVFMLGQALRLLNVHPIFRYFQFEPPKSFTRFVRRFAKNADGGIVAAAGLGLFTLLIPCGITQVAMAGALASGSALHGAALLFAFTLGTTPLFFTLALLATGFSGLAQKRFTLVAAVLVLVLGAVSLEGGLNLVGSPVSYAKVSAALRTDPQPVAVGESAPASPTHSTSATDNGAAVLRVKVTSSGYAPERMTAQAGAPLRLVFDSEQVNTCARALTIPALGIQKVLPQTGETTIDIPAQQKGTLAFTCSMGMYTSQIQFL
jgi:sulfite exporter TauE/SafE